MNDGGAALGVADDLGDPRPEPARGAQLGDGEELVVVGGQPEADLPQGLCDGQPGVGEQPQVGHRGRDGAGQLPGGVGAQVVQGGSVDGDRPHTAARGRAGRHGDHLLRRRGLPAAELRGQRVGAQVDGHGGALLRTQLVEQRQQGFACPGVVGARVEDDGHQVEVHAREQLGELGGRHAGLAHADPQRADPLGEGGQHRGVAVTAGNTERLGHLPARVDVAQRVAAAHVGPLAGQRRLGQLVERGVERPDGDSVIRRGLQQPLGLVPQLAGILAGALGQHTGDRTAPTPANLF